MTHEGARSILGAYLSLAGASAAAIGFISGFGEFCGYSLRLLFCFMADKTHRYWPLTIIGYAVQVVAILLLALVPEHGWILAGIFIIAERIGKAVKKPAKNALVSFAASQIGQGKGFAYQEFLDQIGAFLGPVMLFVVCAIKGTDHLFSTYSLCFAVLGIPAVITMVLLLVAKHKFPHPETFEKETGPSEPFKMKKQFVFYIIAISLFAMGFVDFTMITMHAAKASLVPEQDLSLLYAGAMIVDALAALLFGWLYDKYGIKMLIISTLCSAPFSFLVFFLNNQWALFGGILLWGVGMGAQESIMKAAVSGIVPKAGRSTGYGIFETMFGVAWFLGSWLMGALYDIRPLYLVIFSIAAQLAAIPFYIACRKR